MAGSSPVSPRTSFEEVGTVGPLGTRAWNEWKLLAKKLVPTSRQDWAVGKELEPFVWREAATGLRPMPAVRFGATIDRKLTWARCMAIIVLTAGNPTTLLEFEERLQGKLSAVLDE